MFDESPSEAWRHRYGSEPPSLPDMGKFLNHRSIRRFKPDPIPEEMLIGLIAAAQSAATSSTLQLWSVISVQDPGRRAEIAELCADQKQIHTCAVFLCFVADHYRLKRAAEKYEESCEGLGHADFFTVSAIDAGIAAERLVCAAESFGLGACYIGALRNDAMGVVEFLGLPTGTFGLFGLCLGWPKEPMEAHIKPRLSQDTVWFRERYDREVDVAEYDERMRGYYESEKMNPDVTWSARSGRRVDLHHMTGRETLLDSLHEQGFLLS